eukprot:CAMPEP_0201284572 /NCGR_PEP_ID=MMETSP1317-20130820/78150_1 /ASSEMBLY_ACC=CAM_ASM_000770 /TAXON_ID=187299 /ORGANISM="Undescribed Undescribed, Strain Undescribed" /LENGTH=47 /DNA_ID= /DNA_START= /DNA_END= /DNA_ORIENTATION=
MEWGEHSGAAGGIVPSTWRIVSEILERIWDPETGILAGLKVDIEPEI